MHLPFAFSKGNLLKEIENIFFRVSIELVETLGERVRNSKLRTCELPISRFSRVSSCFYNSFETQKMFSIFLKYFVQTE